MSDKEIVELIKTLTDLLNREDISLNLRKTTEDRLEKLLKKLK